MSVDELRASVSSGISRRGRDTSRSTLPPGDPAACGMIILTRRARVRQLCNLLVAPHARVPSWGWFHNAAGLGNRMVKVNMPDSPGDTAFEAGKK